MRSLPQTELTVDSESVDEPSTSQTASSSPPNNGKQQQQQVDAEHDAGNISREVTGPGASAPATPTAAAADDDNGGGKAGKDDVDGKSDPVLYTCARCYQQFSDETRYEKHCKKCRDD